MRRYLEELKDFIKKGDMFLLILCVCVAGFGVVCIASATSAEKFDSNFKYIAVQVVSIGLGVLLYALVSSIDLDYLSEHRGMMVAFNVFLLLMLISPLGTDNNTGNRSWINLKVISVQPAEICKITYIIINASVMASHQNRISHPVSIIHLGFHLALLVCLNLALSSDMGVSLIFVFIFIGMAFAGGVSLVWFAIAIAGIAAISPLAWKLMGTYQQERIRVLVDPEFDKQGLGARYHSKINMMSLTGGGLTGQGLFNGNRTQGGMLFAQHTDYIFSSVGEELGFFGCCAIMILELLIIARCIQVGMRSPEYMRRLICFGAASALMFQLMINVGMCIGVMPVIGLTLPLISYGGSSTVTIYAMLGLVSGVYARPKPLSHERYIQPFRSYGLAKR